MFNSARLKLTAWYSLIIFLICLAFSLTVYRLISAELDRFQQIQEVRLERRFSGQFITQFTPVFIDPDIVTESKNRLILILGLIDAGILAASSAAGFFLAGRTLRPISTMLDDQTRFISDSSHELRTPLTALKSEIEVNLRDKNLTLPAAKNLLKSNLEEVNNLQTLSDYLIKLTQYQKNGKGLPMDDNSSTALAQEAVKKVTPLATAKQITLTTDFTDHPLQGARQALLEMLIIFLDNAIKYSPVESQISFTTQNQDHHVVFTISDPGIGIDDADLPHIFDRFYRGSKSRNKSDVTGYGLGLPIAKEIIDRHHGSVKVKSTSGAGSTFTISLPYRHS